MSERAAGADFRLNDKGQVICWTKVVEIPRTSAILHLPTAVNHAVGYAAWFGDDHPLNVQGKTSSTLGRAAELLAMIAALKRLKASGHAGVEFRTKSDFVHQAVFTLLPILRNNGFDHVQGCTSLTTVHLLKNLDEASHGLEVSYTRSRPWYMEFEDTEGARSLARAGALQDEKVAIMDSDDDEEVVVAAGPAA